ncbi:RNA-binding protein [Pseudaeromonas sp. ZJS20]|uniref:RNA recognition motif domain-containing protein n=1 Tax=Pseudaeromonas aegiceratis TaxID=3153928 RepID=UPI00390C9ACC
MTLLQSSYLRASLLALVLAVLGFILVAKLADLTAASWLAFGLLLGGLLTPLVAGAARDTAPRGNRSQRSAATSAANTDQLEVYTGECKTLYVGNLPYRANEAAVRKLFAEHGQVISVRLVKDKETGKRRGYGFVEMPLGDADAAIAALNETEYLQRTLKVREANEKKESASEFSESVSN